MAETSGNETLEFCSFEQTMLSLCVGANALRYWGQLRR
jgi:hypothetical protein